MLGEQTASAMQAGALLHPTPAQLTRICMAMAARSPNCSTLASLVRDLPVRHGFTTQQLIDATILCVGAGTVLRCTAAWQAARAEHDCCTRWHRAFQFPPLADCMPAGWFLALPHRETSRAVDCPELQAASPYHFQELQAAVRQGQRCLQLLLRQ